MEGEGNAPGDSLVSMLFGFGIEDGQGNGRAEANVICKSRECVSTGHFCLAIRHATGRMTLMNGKLRSAVERFADGQHGEIFLSYKHSCR